MNFITMGLLVAGYTMMYWGWDAMTDRVNAGNAGEIWWPSIKDLVIPANYGKVPKVGFAAGVQPSAQPQATTQADTSAMTTITNPANGATTQVPSSSAQVA